MKKLIIAALMLLPMSAYSLCGSQMVTRAYLFGEGIATLQTTYKADDSISVSELVPMSLITNARVCQVMGTDHANCLQEPLREYREYRDRQWMDLFEKTCGSA